MQCGTSITIGERCMFGQSTLVVDGNHRFRDLDVPMLQQGYDFTPIRIADDATITTKCTIIADVGQRALVAANAVVTRPVPAYSVAAGVPARVIDYFGPDADAPVGLTVSELGQVGLSGRVAAACGLIPGGEEVRRERLLVDAVDAPPDALGEPRRAARHEWRQGQPASASGRLDAPRV